MSAIRSSALMVLSKPPPPLRFRSARVLTQHHWNRLSYSKTSKLGVEATIFPCKKDRRNNLLPFYFLLALGAGCSLSYYSRNQPLLCEPPLPLDKVPEGELSGEYKNFHNYPTYKLVSSYFASLGSSAPGDPEQGLLRHDAFSMIAREPREQWPISDGDDEEKSWSMWGIVDGHAGPYTADVVQELLPDYVVNELLLQAGMDPYSLHRDSSAIFHNCSLQQTVQAIADAFVRLDNDILRLAAQAIIGSRPFQVSLQDLAPADSGSCALLAMWDAASGLLHVANVGDSRAVLGRRNSRGSQGTWEAKALSFDHTGYNKNEVARLRREHPGEPDMIRNGRLLGIAVTRAFGCLRWKLSAHLQSIAQTRFFGLSLLPSFISPPYLTAEPEIGTIKIQPKYNDFLILASGGLWDHLSSEQAVRLVGRWLEKHNPAEALKQPVGFNTIDVADDDDDDDDDEFAVWEQLRNGDIVGSPPDCAIKGKEYTKIKCGDEKNWVVVDDNAATHLARNAMGGADEDLFSALVGASGLYPMRRLRDDITIQVIFFGYGEARPREIERGEKDDELDDLSNSIHHY